MSQQRATVVSGPPTEPYTGYKDDPTQEYTPSIEAAICNQILQANIEIEDWVGFRFESSPLFLSTSEETDGP